MRNLIKERILICGGRDFTDQAFVNKTLDACLPFFDKHFCLIHGGCRGADRAGMEWAFFQGCPVIEMKANWNYHGKRAGFLRNDWMLEYATPDLVIAFPGGRGTDHMINRAWEEGIDVYAL